MVSTLHDRNLVERYLEKLNVLKSSHQLRESGVVTLQLYQKRIKFLADLVELGASGPAVQHWERWLKGNDPYLTLTFDPKAAEERRDVAFITPVHPLARQAAVDLEPAAPLTCSMTTVSNSVPSGRYPFAIYRWRKLGMKEDFTFQSVCTDSNLASHILGLLETAEQANTTQPVTVEEERELEHAHYGLWTKTRASISSR